MSSLADYLDLLKIRVSLMNVFVAFATFIISSGKITQIQAPLLVISGLLAAGGSGVLNNYLDSDIDKKMTRTVHRALARGTVNPVKALILGLTLISASLLISSLTLNYLTTIMIASGATMYVLMYTVLLKRRKSYNIVIGGFAGFFAALAGSTAASNDLTLKTLLIGALVFLWAPSHFWSYAIFSRDDYAKAGIPMLPVISGAKYAARCILWSTILLLLFSVILSLTGWLGPVYSLAAVFAGVWFAYLNLQLSRDASDANARKVYKASSIYLAIIFTAMMMDAALV